MTDNAGPKLKSSPLMSERRPRPGKSSTCAGHSNRIRFHSQSSLVPRVQVQLCSNAIAGFRNFFLRDTNTGSSFAVFASYVLQE
ncbi:hypothetical protein Sfum_1646 [Syntrophobacter fumaroxidans MPOB]|uniref:Uncharacterized protein n=1 Tax=Syntrophobacter fumaroxidans (strain DSM 10017 / MPOB) TaxID=335543 RepID=A0LIT1_SYNFM|nr:hypothetical protein Sfum_1646 [Syntrophobacter fumaroxidans MPOB]